MDQFDTQIQCEEYDAIYDQLETFREWVEAHEAEYLEVINAELREVSAEDKIYV